jgi:hypothetical protein
MTALTWNSGSAASVVASSPSPAHDLVDVAPRERLAALDALSSSPLA